MMPTERKEKKNKADKKMAMISILAVGRLPPAGGFSRFEVGG